MDFLAYRNPRYSFALINVTIRIYELLSPSDSYSHYELPAGFDSFQGADLEITDFPSNQELRKGGL